MNDEIEKFVIEKRNELSKELYDFWSIQKQEIYSELYNQINGLNENIVQYLNYKVQNSISELEQNYLRYQDFFRLKNFFEENNLNETPRIIFLGIPEHGNIGDHAIVCGEENFLRKNFPNVNYIFLSWRCMEENMIYLKTQINSKDIIAIQGGGFLGTLWENEQEKLNLALQNFKNNPIFIFPQTFWSDAEENEKNILESFGHEMQKCVSINVCLREKASLQRFKTFYPNVHAMLVPDMALCINVNLPQSLKSDILLCFRKDKEKMGEYEDTIKELMEEKKYSYKCISTVNDGKILYPYGEKYVWNKLVEFSKARLVITDRLHGMIFSAIVGTPCIVFNNSSGKIRGVHSWLNMSNNVCMVSNLDDLKKKFEEMLYKTPERFVVNAGYYTELLKCLNEYIFEQYANKMN